MRKVVAGVAFAAAAAMFSMAGLAYAGVTLPQPTQAAFNSVGITLPNQGGSPASQSEHGQEVKTHAQSDKFTGCAHGQDVAAVASAGHSQGHGPKCDDQGDLSTEGTTSGSDGQAGPQSQPADNHGAAVSAVAKNGTTGCDHGKEVSVVARDDHGNGNGPNCPAGNSGESGGGTPNNPGANGPANNPTDNGPGNNPGH